jgi:DsbC/DsbD-like thiol-disulfide interchange protein
MKRSLTALLLVFPALGGNPLAITLISETKVIAPGQTFLIGLHLKPPAGFHTYWKHPGIVGLATSVEWSLPPGFTAGEIRWPAPETVTMARYTAQGYRGETLLMVPVTTPRELTKTPVELTARVSWMCCGAQCHPGAKVPFTITLPVADASEPAPATRPLFDKFRAKLPQAEPAWSTIVERREKTLVLTVKSTDPGVTRDVNDLGALRFFTADGQVDSDGGQKVTIGPGQTVRIELPVSASGPAAAKGLPGVVHAEKGWRRDGSLLDLEIK